MLIGVWQYWGAGFTILNINELMCAFFCRMYAYWSLTCKGDTACAYVQMPPENPEYMQTDQW